MQKNLILFILLIVFSLAIRMPFLWHPDEVVFDEVHFGEFVSAYYTGEYYFDIHPPLGKLLIAGFAYFFDFRAGFDFANIGAAYGDIPYAALRFLPNLAGALIPVAVVAFLLVLGIPKGAAFIAGALLALDGALLVQSRFILVDAFLILFGFAGLWLFFRARNRGYRAWDLILAGAVLAMSFSVKWTGLAFFGLAIAVMLWDLVSGRGRILRAATRRPGPEAVRDEGADMASRIPLSPNCTVSNNLKASIADGRDPRKSILTLFGDFRDEAARSVLGSLVPPKAARHARSPAHARAEHAPAPFFGLRSFPRTLRTLCESRRRGVLQLPLVGNFHLNFTFESRAALRAGRDAGQNTNSEENRMRKRGSPTERSEGARFPEGFRAIFKRICSAGVIGRAESGKGLEITHSSNNCNSRGAAAIGNWKLGIGNWKLDLCGFGKIVGSFAVLVATAIGIYLAVFWVHFALLPNPGPGDVFMSENFREQSFLAQTLELNRVMFEANRGLEATHPDGSPAWSWPLMMQSIFYWVGNFEGEAFDGEPRTAWIYLLGNPIVWWLSTIGLFAGVFFWRPKSKMLAEAKWILYAGWLMHILPFLGIQRVVFLYHYLPALVFAVAIFSVWLYDALPRAKLARVAGAIIGVAAIAFIFFAPLLYGLPLSESQFEMRMWLPGWR